MRHLLVNKQTGVADNAVDFPDDLTGADAPGFENSYLLVAHPTAPIGVHWDGQVFTPDAAPGPPLPPLDEMKVVFCAAVDGAAETERLKYVTPGAGQAMEYQQAAAEARAVLAAGGNLDPADYPMLAASLGIDGDTILAVATAIAQRERDWIQIGAAIKRVRLQARAAIEAAADHDAVHAVYAGIVWPEVA